MRIGTLVAGIVVSAALASCGGERAVPDPLDGGTPVPAVIGLPVEEAHHLLTKAGFDVREVQRLDCLTARRVEGTTPTPGTPIAAGSTVTLTYSDVSAGGDCLYAAQERAWEFLDWASGRVTQPPRFARSVGDPVSPPASWAHATEIAEAAFTLRPTGDGISAQPALSAQYAGCAHAAACLGEEPRVDVRLTLAGQPYAAFRLFLRRGMISGFRTTALPPAGD
jgi:hypothetical protein